MEKNNSVQIHTKKFKTTPTNIRTSTLKNLKN